MELSKFQKATEVREEITALESKINQLVRVSSRLCSKDYKVVIATKNNSDRAVSMYHGYELPTNPLFSLEKAEINLLIAHYELQLEDARERFKEI